MSSKVYDFAIVGAGAAGLQLAKKMAEDPFFDKKEVLILEKQPKEANDKTWSFWEIGETDWDLIATKVWQNGLFISDQEVALSLAPYRYKTIRSADFYAHCGAIVKDKANFEWVEDEAQEIREGKIIGANGSYTASYIFDSRINQDFFSKQHEYHTLVQHFKGWVIETKDPIFDPSVFVMMDYRLQWKDHTSFTYVLPFSEREALVEFTLFNQELLADEQYNEMLRQYIKKYLKTEVFEIKEVEKGQIPMSTYPFHEDHRPGITKIGTAGGWVRPSSGYSFKNADQATTKIVENIKKGRNPHRGIHNKLHWFFDLIFLKVLTEKNALGVQIFSIFYQKHPVRRILRFLDKESSLYEDFRIVNSLNRKEFRNAFLSLLKFR